VLTFALMSSPGGSSNARGAARHQVPTLGLLAAATRAPVTIPREASVREAETQMLADDYSQLPVMTGGRTVHGMISWKSIGRAQVAGKAGPNVVDCMDDEIRVLPISMSLIDAVSEIIRHEVVLVKDHDRKITGIVTTTDLSENLRDLTHAFLLIGNIERQVRRLVGDRFNVQELRAFVPSNRSVEGVEDLSLGETVRLLQVPGNWTRLRLKVDAAIVLERLERVRKTRNAVLHFRTDPIDAAALRNLHSTESFLASL